MNRVVSFGDAMYEAAADHAHEVAAEALRGAGEAARD